MVSYIEFLSLVRDGLADYLPEDCRNVQIEVSRANKKIGKSYDGIQLCVDGSAVGISYDLSHYYSAMDDISELPSILRLIAAEFVDALRDTPPSLGEIMADPKYLKKRLIIDVTNASDYKNELKTMPHKIFDDMAVIYRLIYIDPLGEMFSTVLTNELIQQMGLTEEELFQIAAENTSEIFPMEIISLRGTPAKPQAHRGTIRDKNGDLVQPDDIDVLFRAFGHGAECFFYPNFIEEIQKIIPDSFFIIPFATTEILVVHDIGDISIDFINEIAFSAYVNRIDPHTRLTKTVYYYDDETDTLGPVEHYSHKMLQL